MNKFPVKGPRILVGPGENAGVVDLGKGNEKLIELYKDDNSFEKAAEFCLENNLKKELIIPLANRIKNNMDEAKSKAAKLKLNNQNNI